MSFYNMLFSIVICLFMSCDSRSQVDAGKLVDKKEEIVSVIIPAADRQQDVLRIVKGKSIACVVNQTSRSKEDHIVDFLLANDVDVKVIFAPEHGFRGKEDAGAQIVNGVESKSGLSIISLYGKKKKPAQEDLLGVDLILFDIQDVGARFYTYISSMHYVMEAAAEQDIAMVVLDRPNPNAHYVDGPMLLPEWRSFVGMHTVPVVYGMTIGEYAQMINGEGWLSSKPCELMVVRCLNYDHNKIYELPVKPSPNLPNLRSILLYPSLCFFEGTNVSIGRGTDKQFQIVGAPVAEGKLYQFTPKPSEGAKYPKHQDKVCYGDNLSALDVKTLHSEKRLNLSYLLEYAEIFNQKDKAYFLENLFFDKLAGSNQLRKQIQQGLNEEQIRASWQKDLDAFKQIRAKYLLY